MTLELSHQPMHPIFIPWCAGGSRHGRLVRKHIPDSDPGCALQSTSMPAFHGRNVPNCRPMVDGGMRKCSAGACPPLGSGWGVAESAVPIRCTKPQLRLFIPWCAGAAGMSDCYESMSRTTIRDRLPPLISSFQRKLESRRVGKGIVALELVPSLGRAVRSPTSHRPAPRDFHPLMRPSQGHGDFGESRNPPSRAVRGFELMAGFDTK